MFVRSLLRYALVVAIVPCVVSSPRAEAAEPAPSPSPSAVPAAVLRPIGEVVTSDRKPEPIGLTSQPTFVIDRARIESFGDRTVADALQDVPGVELFSYGAFGAQTNYGIRGSTSAQTLVLVDGIPVTDPTTGAIQLSQFSTIGVQRIEIVESGSSTLYGTSASGGVINIITRVPRGEYLAASAGSFNDRDVRAAVGDGTVGFSFERHVATNAYPYGALDYGPASSYPAGIRSNAEGDSTTGRFSLDLPTVDGFVVRARVDASGSYIGAPSSLQYPSQTATQNTSTDSVLLDLVRASAASTLTISLAGSKTRSAYVDVVGANGEDDVDTGRSQISVRQSFTSSRVLDGVAGIDLSRESGVFSFPTSPNYSSSNAAPIPAYALGEAQAQAAAYAQIGVAPFSGARFTAGLRGENDSPHGSVLAPSFGGTIRSGALRFSGDIGESFRVPTLEDLYYPGYSNPNLLPEKAQTADATVAFEAPRATFSAGWFDRNGSNFIVDNPVTYIPFNAQHAESAGVVVTASTKPFAGLIAEASYTNLYRALDVTTGARLPSNPVGQAALTISHPFAGADKLSYGLRWGIVGSDGTDASVVKPLAGSYDAYDRLDAYLRYKLTKETVLSVRGSNLGNETYAPLFAYPAPGRSIQVELSTR
ncbi:MAG: TonB-dependent receptor [Candidatus Eremiobacteraeota bacterium]|nr:TonB-dependent receptor [Candidatus Eremiobacteraeota bacterium]